MEFWKPHGLIQKPGLEEPYQDAKLSIDELGNERDPKEHYTVHLFEDLFNKQIFTGDLFYVNSQQPPSKKKGSDKAVDIVIKYLDNDYRHQILCFAEAKRARNTIYSKVRDLENQAQGYCQDFLDAHPGIDLVYACTLVGACIRCWLYNRGDYKLVGFWSGNKRDDFRHYRDVGLDEHKSELEKAFDLMKSVPPTAIRLGQDPSAIGSRLGALSKPEPVYSQYSASVTYTQPPTEYSRGYPAASSASTPSREAPNTAPYEAARAPTQPMEVEYPNVPQLLDKDYVEVAVYELGDSIWENVYRFIHGDRTLERKGSDWHEEIVLRHGRSIPCMVCIGRTSATRYWTWTLDPESESVTVNLKNKGKGKKRH